MKPLHIAMITRSVPTKDYPTMGIFEYDYAKAFVEAGHRVSILAVDMRSFLRKRKFGIESYEKGGISITVINWPVGNVPKKMLYAIAYQALKKIYARMVERDGIPDLIHATFTDYAYLGSLLKKDTGIPLYICEPNSHINTDPIHPPLFRAANTAYHAADCVQAVSPKFQTRLKNVFGIDSVYIPILPDLSVFRYWDGERQKRIVSTGRIVKAKGMRELVEAFRIVYAKYPEYRLEIFGEGDERESLEKLVSDWDLQESVQFHGLVPRERIAATYDESEIFALCSHHETFGLSYIEAWGAGLPVLSTRCGGPEHAFTEDNGILVEVGDVQQIADGLLAMIGTDYDRRKISEDAHREFSKARIIGDIVKQFYRITK